MYIATLVVGWLAVFRAALSPFLLVLQVLLLTGFGFVGKSAKVAGRT